jgi:Ca2+-transporting ATPase
MSYCTAQGYTETEVRTSVFSALVMANIFLTLTGRSEKYSILTTIRYPNKLVPGVILFTAGVLTLLLTSGPVSRLFGLQTPDAAQFLLSLATALASVLWIEFYKKIILRKS